MAKTLQLRRGTTAEVGAITSAAGELLVDTDKKTVTVGDGSTAGGTPLATDVRVSSAFNAANAASGFAGSAYGQANAATNSAQSAYNTANTAQTSASSALDSAQSAYNQANTATSGLSSKQNTLVSGTSIKTINGNSLLGSGDLTISGGGGSSATSNSLAIVPESSDFTTIANLSPSDVQYFPTTSNVSVAGSLILTANTTAFNTTSNNYVDVVAYSYGGTSYPYSLTTYMGKEGPVQGLAFVRRMFGANTLPEKVQTELDNLKVGSKVTLKFIAGANNSVVDIFTIPLVVAYEPKDWVEFGAQYGTSYATQGDKASGNGTGVDFSVGSSSSNLKGKIVWFKSPIVQPSYSGSPTKNNTTLVGERYGNPIHQSFLTNPDGSGHIRFDSLNYNVNSSYAQGCRTGIAEVIFEKPSGTVARISSNTQFTNVLQSANTIAIDGNVSSIESPISVWDKANNKVLLSKSDITARVVEGTVLQAYNASQKPVLDLGSLKFYSDPTQKKLITDVNLAKGKTVEILGTVSSNSTIANTWTIPTTFTNKYLSQETHKGYYASSTLTNAVYFDQTNYTTPGSLTLINLTDDVYNATKANGTYIYFNCKRNGVKQNIICQVINQGSNSFFIQGYTAPSWTQNRPWVKLNCVGYIQGSTVSSNGSVTNPTWDYDTQESTLKIATEIVTLQTDQNTVNAVVRLISESPQNPGLNGFTQANNNQLLYVNGISANVVGVDIANNTILMNLPKVVYGNTNFTGTTITSIKAPSNYATIADVQDQLPTWIPATENSTLKNSTNYVLGGGTGGIALRALDINSIMGQNDYQVSGNLKLTKDDANRKQAHRVSRGMYYDRYPSISQVSSQSARVHTMTVSGSIWTGMGLYANTSIGSKDLIYTSNSVAETVTVSKKLIVTSNATSQIDSDADKTVALLSGYNPSTFDYYDNNYDSVTGQLIDVNAYAIANFANTGYDTFTADNADFSRIAFDPASKGPYGNIGFTGTTSGTLQTFFDTKNEDDTIAIKFNNAQSNTTYEGIFVLGPTSDAAYCEVKDFIPAQGTTNNPITDGVSFTSSWFSSNLYVRDTVLSDPGVVTGQGGNVSYIRSNMKHVPPGAPSYARSVQIGKSTRFGNDSTTGVAGCLLPNKKKLDLNNVNESWTIEMWFANSEDNSTFYPIISGESSDTAENILNTYTGGPFNSKIEFPFYLYVNRNGSTDVALNEMVSTSHYGGIYQADQNGTGYNSYLPSGQQWYHISYNYDAANYKFYVTIDGFLVGFYDIANNGYSWPNGNPMSTKTFGVASSSGATLIYNYRATKGLARYKPHPSKAWMTPANGALPFGSRLFYPEEALMPFSSNKDEVKLGNTNFDAIDLHGGLKIQNITLSAANTANANVSNSSVSSIPVNAQGGYLYVSEGSLYYKGSNGTSTLVATA